MIATLAQFAYPVLLLARHPGRGLLLAGILGNSLIIALYVITRTVGIPFLGPAAGEVEPVGGLDAISKVTELALIVALVVLLRFQTASGLTSGEPR